MVEIPLIQKFFCLHPKSTKQRILCRFVLHSFLLFRFAFNLSQYRLERQAGTAFIIKLVPILS